MTPIYPYFGLNDHGPNHINGRQWQPSELNPTAYRFFMPWDNDTWYAQSYTDNMLLGAFANGPDRIGIMVMTPAVNTGPPQYRSPVPDATTFYWEVREWLVNTPSNLYLQVWNEPNSPTYGTSGVAMQASTCRGLISAAYSAARDLGQPGRIIGPAMSPGLPDWEQYMIDAYADRLVPAAVHIYPKSQPWTQDFDLAIKRGKHLTNSDGKIYITEMGLRYKWQTGTDQNGNPVWSILYGSNWAAHSRDAYLRAAADSAVRAVIFHRLVYDPTAAQHVREFDENGRLYFLINNPPYHTRTELVSELNNCDPNR